MWLNSLKVFLTLVGVFSLVGCATMHKEPAAGNDLKDRISQLEEQLEQKDEEIADLKDQVQMNSQDFQRGDSSYSRKSSMSSNSVSTKKDGILRVDVAPEQVQLALKNAGYYSGPIDGKIGGKTKRAVSDFQKARNITADGVIGKKTWSLLKEYLKS